MDFVQSMPLSCAEVFSNRGGPIHYWAELRVHFYFSLLYCQNLWFFRMTNPYEPSVLWPLLLHWAKMICNSIIKDRYLIFCKQTDHSPSIRLVIRINTIELRLIFHFEFYASPSSIKQLLKFSSPWGWHCRCDVWWCHRPKWSFRCSWQKWPAGWCVVHLRKKDLG